MKTASVKSFMEERYFNWQRQVCKVPLAKCVIRLTSLFRAVLCGAVHFLNDIKTYQIRTYVVLQG